MNKTFLHSVMDNLSNLSFLICSQSKCCIHLHQDCWLEGACCFSIALFRICGNQATIIYNFLIEGPVVVFVVCTVILLMLQKQFISTPPQPPKQMSIHYHSSIVTTVVLCVRWQIKVLLYTTFLILS